MTPTLSSATSLPSVAELERLAAIAGVSPLELLELAEYAQREGIPVDKPGTMGGSRQRPERVVDWAQRSYYITETLAPIVFEQHQIALLDYMFERDSLFTTYIWATIKKSGKTAVSSLISRWVAECFGNFPEVILAANDMEQARGRLYQAIVNSIELTPGYDQAHHVLRDKNGETLWRIIERELRYVPNHGLMRAISGDYKGEAGSNPNASFWTELWAYTKEASLRLWEELTPVATRKDSFRFIDTYAGYTNEKGTLWDLYRRIVIQGRQLTCHDLPTWPEQWLALECNCGTELGCCPDHNDAPGPDGKRDRMDMGGLPVFVHEPSNSVAYWDVGERARRMPWQDDRYYMIEAASLRPNAYKRLHRNEWTESAEAFIPIVWWDANRDDDLLAALQAAPDYLGITDKRESIVLAADGAVSGDCCGLTMHTRHPKRRNQACLRAAWVWYPPAGGKFDYQRTIEQKIRYILQGCVDCVEHKGCNGAWVEDKKKFVHTKWDRWNVVCLTYDEFQLHDMMMRFAREGLVWTKQFGQGTPRTVADKQLFDCIRERTLGHPGAPSGYGDLTLGLEAMREHLANANSKQKQDEDTGLRIIKKDAEQKIDLAICNAMGNNECMRLDLE